MLNRRARCSACQFFSASEGDCRLNYCNVDSFNGPDFSTTYFHWGGTTNEATAAIWVMPNVTAIGELNQSGYQMQRRVVIDTIAPIEPAAVVQHGA